MKEKVDPMVAERMQPPKCALDAKSGVNQRKILRRRIERKPNPPQTIRGGQYLVICYVLIVIPDETAVHCRLIGQYRDHRQNQAENPVAFPPTYDRRLVGRTLLRLFIPCEGCASTTSCIVSSFSSVLHKGSLFG